LVRRVRVLERVGEQIQSERARSPGVEAVEQWRRPAGAPDAPSRFVPRLQTDRCGPAGDVQPGWPAGGLPIELAGRCWALIRSAQVGAHSPARLTARVGHARGGDGRAALRAVGLPGSLNSSPGNQGGHRWAGGLFKRFGRCRVTQLGAVREGGFHFCTSLVRSEIPSNHLSAAQPGGALHSSKLSHGICHSAPPPSTLELQPATALLGRLRRSPQGKRPLRQQGQPWGRFRSLSFSWGVRLQWGWKRTSDHSGSGQAVRAGSRRNVQRCLVERPNWPTKRRWGVASKSMGSLWESGGETFTS